MTDLHRVALDALVSTLGPAECLSRVLGAPPAVVQRDLKPENQPPTPGRKKPGRPPKRAPASAAPNDGQRLVQLLEQRHTTSAAAARAAGCDSSLWSKVRSGRERAGPKMLARLRAAVEQGQQVRGADAGEEPAPQGDAA